MAGYPTRRRVLAGLAATLAAPAVARANTPTDTDVVIVGAGAAGLAAARTFTRFKVPFVCLEARERIGGRAYTDDGIFGAPVDFGCAELHHARFNPWVKYAEKSGFAVGPLPPSEANAIYDGDSQVDDATSARIEAEFGRHKSALVTACRQGRDISAATAFAGMPVGRWTRSMRNWLGPIATGQDVDRISTVDWCSGVAGQDWFAPAGFGAIIAHYGRAVPVTLNAPVSSIKWGPAHVDVISSKGRLRARLALITVPVGVLTAEAIAFAPALPEWKRAALGGMDMSHYLRVLLKLDVTALDQPFGSWVTARMDGGEGFSFWVDPGGHGVTHAIAGGRFAAELELAGDDVSADLAMGALAAMFGSKIRRGLTDSFATVWSQDPFSRGAWAAAKPGYAAARKLLSKPVGERLYFAGEADHAEFWGTAGGAAIAGSIVAKRIVDKLRV
ncbi:hypothetical protein MNBD_ALPHA09-928 [hydrothermal vent metagenome]|uniref:Amine oxidase domain-containing protein n=1 Tax=hydrothermal vent metagenome TaxID=652676 RepID=A0A3B0SZX4_9ZZZZ